MKKVGILLKEAREKKGVSIAEVSHITKINVKTIKAIEDGETDSLPQKAFVRGFIQTYAKYLGLDVKNLLDMFQEEVGVTKPVLPKTDPVSGVIIPATEKKSTLSAASDFEIDPAKKSKSWLLAIAIALLGLLIFVAVELVQKYEREEQVSPQELAVEALPESSPLPTDESTTTTLDTNANSEATVAASPSPGEAAGTAATSTTTTKHTTTSTSTTSTSTTSKTTTSTSSTTTTKQTTTTTTKLTTTTTTKTPASTTTTSLVKTISMEVIVEALDNVQLGYRIDNGSFKTIKLAPEQVHTFKATQSLNIDVSDGGSINIIYNGVDKGHPGTLGQPIKLKYP